MIAGDISTVFVTNYQDYNINFGLFRLLIKKLCYFFRYTFSDEKFVGEK